MLSTTAPLDPRIVQSIFARHLPVYQARVPHYQALLLDSLAEVWCGHHATVLDVGGGTGVMAEAIARVLPASRVQAIDVVDRFCRTLSIDTACYDGSIMPFASGSFEAATLNNVLHHVPVGERPALLREIRRVVQGPLYIKDHVSTGVIDDWRLTALDAIGNIPFGGMVRAEYLSAAEWQAVAAASGWRIAAWAAPRAYRSGLQRAIFPNRLEATMRLDPA